ncbi:phosphatidate cytidylyltransferase [Mesorhizobium sp. J18]|uniref:phosphatidate cytidylyltransferase n=1 Tax=Mesorhizobium sp. J18 TaxID=935263 RepID=UPI00119B4870|nr:phosphatidate cytidylyltransferase [Mesorhizobium sp. J18]TWG99094.1 phosphatidate cytidylyltransferase [Mesorhizobium sp. J18]
MSNLQLRIISALVLGAAVLALTYLGGLPFRLLMAAMAAAIFHEWTSMGRTRSSRAHFALAWLLTGLILLLLIAGAGPQISFGVLCGAVLVCLLHAWLARQGGWTAAGLLYAVAPALALSFLRSDSLAGFAAMLFLFAVVWVTDILAYFTGRAVGGPKLAPSISPGKTWSGAIGGTVFGVIAGLAVVAWTGSLLGTAAMATVALCLSIVSQLGDLFESAMKRRHGVKDSGNLIPGHGGVMDRVDGLVAAAALFYLIGAFIAGGASPAGGFFQP